MIQAPSASPGTPYSYSIVGRLHTSFGITAASRTTATCRQSVCGVPADSAAAAEPEILLAVFRRYFTMSKSIAFGGALVFFGAVLGSGPASAHHSYAMFDNS